MNPKIEKLEKEIEKTKTKIAEMQAKLHKLEEQKTELENTDYVAVARSFKLTPPPRQPLLLSACPHPHNRWFRCQSRSGNPRPICNTYFRSGPYRIH